MSHVLITGGAGFIGHHLLEHWLLNTDDTLICLDKLDSSSTLHRIDEVLNGKNGKLYPTWKSRVNFVFHDLRSEINTFTVNQIGKVNYILHLAAGSHVDRSIEDPMSFVMDNVVGTANILNYARQLDSLDLFYQMGTDEVFGPAPEGTKYKEWDRYNSTNPYSATKASAEELCLAFANTYKLPLIIGHAMNNFGERQHPEKYIPMCVKKIRDNELVTIHASSKGKPGQRHYLHARNMADAILFLVHGNNWTQRDKYNIVGEKEMDNLQLAQLIAKIMNKNLKYKLVDFHSNRPGHDLRYALDGSKMAQLGWSPSISFESSLTQMVNWTLANSRWLE